MAILIYGRGKTPIGFDEVCVKCPSCEKDSWADLMAESVYFHLFWVPFFPFEKKASLICQECGLKRYDLPFDPVFFSDYKELKHKFRHPLKTYLLLLFIFFLVTVTVIFEAK